MNSGVELRWDRDMNPWESYLIWFRWFFGRCLAIPLRGSKSRRACTHAPRFVGGPGVLRGAPMNSGLEVGLDRDIHRIGFGFNGFRPMFSKLSLCFVAWGSTRRPQNAPAGPRSPPGGPRRPQKEQRSREARRGPRRLQALPLPSPAPSPLPSTLPPTCWLLLGWGGAQKSKIFCS